MVEGINMLRFFQNGRAGKFAALLLGSALMSGSALAGDPVRLPVTEAEPPPIRGIPAAEQVAAPTKPTIAPAAPTTEAAPVIIEEGPGCGGGDGKKLKFPPITPLPKPGIPLILPTGPGYFSLLDQIQGNYLEKPPKYPYSRVSIQPQSMFDIDWSYLDDPNNTEHDFFDCLKRIPIGDCAKFTTGGEFRWRYANEVDSRLSNKDNTYDLMRIRLYGDLTIGDRIRLFVEGLYAECFYNDLAPLKTDIDRGDLLNAFVELRTIDIGDDPLYVRVGRQELVYGSQRLISALDWANTRRTFQGVKAYWHTDNLNVDAFLVNPVVPNPDKFDSVDDKQTFAGTWLTWKSSCKTRLIDAYYLYLDNQNQTPVAQGLPPGPTRVHTIGGRYYGEEENGLLTEAEGAIQLGDFRNNDLFAQMATVGIGYNAKNVTWNPQAWLYFDYASGDSSPNKGTYHTFNQLFPFNHYYFGFLDLIGRQNITDLNAQVAFYPQNWLTVWTQYHVLNLDKSQDALYNSAGAPIRRDPTGQAGHDVGQILDVLFNIHIDKHSDIFFTYGHLFSGDFIRGTKPGPNRVVDYTLLQYSYRW
jgi:hypothetical protein